MRRVHSPLLAMPPAQAALLCPAMALCAVTLCVAALILLPPLPGSGVVVLLVCCPAIDGMTVGKSWVSNLLREHQRAMAAYSLAIKHRVPDPMTCNAVWGMDLTFKQDEAGEMHPILGSIDHGSRKALVPLVERPHRAFVWHAQENTEPHCGGELRRAHTCHDRIQILLQPCAPASAFARPHTARGVGWY